MIGIHLIIKELSLDDIWCHHLSELERIRHTLISSHNYLCTIKSNFVNKKDESDIDSCKQKIK